MQDRPTLLELLDAVRGFLEKDVVPALEGPRAFHARVSANLLAIVGRELRDGDAQLRDEWRRLTEILGAGGQGNACDAPGRRDELHEAVAALNRELADRIRRGDADVEPLRSRVLAHLRSTADDKLRIANPRYLEAIP